MVKYREGREGAISMKKFIFSAFVLGLLACLSQGPLQADHPKGAFISDRNGDVNGDGLMDVSDPVFLLNFMYLGGTEPALLGCAPFNQVENGDIDGSGQYEITDPIRLLSFLYLGGPPPVEGCPES
jgi:hypothetical protein